MGKIRWWLLLFVIGIGIFVAIVSPERWQKPVALPFTLNHVIRAHTAHVVRLAFSHDGELLTSMGRWDREVKVWRVRDRRLVHALVVSSVNPITKPLSLAFSLDGKWLAIGYSDGVVRLFQLADEKLKRILTWGSPALIWRVAFSPDGQWIVSCALSKVLIW